MAIARFSWLYIIHNAKALTSQVIFWLEKRVWVKPGWTKSEELGRKWRMEEKKGEQMRKGREDHHQAKSHEKCTTQTQTKAATSRWINRTLRSTRFFGPLLAYNFGHRCARNGKTTFHAKSGVITNPRASHKLVAMWTLHTPAGNCNISPTTTSKEYIYTECVTRWASFSFLFLLFSWDPASLSCSPFHSFMSARYPYSSQSHTNPPYSRESHIHAVTSIQLKYKDLTSHVHPHISNHIPISMPCHPTLTSFTLLSTSTI